MYKISSKLSAAILVTIFVASALAMTSDIKTVKATDYSIHSTPTTVYGYPQLGTLPSGVTPDYTTQTTAYMSITPNPIGKGQLSLINVWVTPGQPNFMHMSGYKITVQKPDGTHDVIGPFNSYIADDTAWIQFSPDQVGTWRFKFEQPGTYVPVGLYVSQPGAQGVQGSFLAGNQSFGGANSYYGENTVVQLMYPNGTYYLAKSIYYTPSSTDWQNLTVQENMVASWPTAAMPNDYWREPVSPMNREWISIMGYYPWNGIYYYPGGRMYYPSNYQYTPYVQAPNTAHVVWRRSGALGGLMGADMGYMSYTSGGGTPTIVFQGRCYQTVTKPMSTLINGSQVQEPVSVWECYDLRTGQVYWDQTGIVAPPTLVVGEEPVSSNQEALGLAASSWQINLVAITNPSGNTPGRLIKYSPYNGAVSLNVTCLPPGMTYGALVNYTQVYSLQTINDTAGIYRLILWDTRGTSSNFTTRILNNITWPMNGFPRGTVNLQGTDGAVDYEAGVAVYGSRFQWSYCIGHDITGVDLKTGAVLYHLVTNDSLKETAQTLSTFVADRGKFAYSAQNRHFNCYDIRTGAKLWESELTKYPWGNWWCYNIASIDLNETTGAIIAGTYDGYYAIDWATGKILWEFREMAPAFEEPYGTYPFFTGVKEADGKIFAYTGEHTPSQPISRGWSIYCINATNGNLIWKMPGPMTAGAIADGYLTASNSYDGYMYVFGKGKTTTTVTAPNTAIPKGTAITIQGTVMDMSPGDQGSQTNPVAPLDSPTQPGTIPCVNAASMTTQMAYLYEQQPIDGIWHNETITGVPVTLTAIDQSGNIIDIGTVTTNGYYGTFSHTWNPPNEGQYTIIASFSGDNSYGSSNAACALLVSTAAPSVTPTSSGQAETVNNDNTPLIYATAGIIAAIVIVGVFVILTLRKRA
jgi:hypothetical protein